MVSLSPSESKAQKFADKWRTLVGAKWRKAHQVGSEPVELEQARLKPFAGCHMMAMQQVGETPSEVQSRAVQFDPAQHMWI